MLTVLGLGRSIRALSKLASGRFHGLVINGIHSNVNFVICNNFMDTSPVAQWLRECLMAIVARDHLVVTTAYGGSGSSG